MPWRPPIFTSHLVWMRKKWPHVFREHACPAFENRIGYTKLQAKIGSSWFSMKIYLCKNHIENWYKFPTNSIDTKFTGDDLSKDYTKNLTAHLYVFKNRPKEGNSDIKTNNFLKTELYIFKDYLFLNLSIVFNKHIFVHQNKSFFSA